MQLNILCIMQLKLKSIAIAHWVIHAVFIMNCNQLMQVAEPNDLRVANERRSCGGRKIVWRRCCLDVYESRAEAVSARHLIMTMTRTRMTCPWPLLKVTTAKT